MPFGDYHVYIPKAVFESADPGNPKLSDNTHLVSYYDCPLDEEMWAKLERLQKKFGNLSNESVSTITSLAKIVETQVRIAYGHGPALQEFFRRKVGDGQEELMNLIPGIKVTYMGLSLTTYALYLERYTVAKKPI